MTRLDRLARSVGDLHRITAQLVSADVDFRCIQQGGVDTTTSAGRLTLAMLGAVAEFENDIRRERQRDGIERAKERGIYKGRPATISPAQIRLQASAGKGATAIARELGISRASVTAY